MSDDAGLIIFILGKMEEGEKFFFLSLSGIYDPGNTDSSVFFSVPNSRKGGEQKALSLMIPYESNAKTFYNNSAHYEFIYSTTNAEE